MKQAELRNSGRLIVTGAGIRDLYSAKGGGLKIVRSFLITLNEQDGHKNYLWALNWHV